MSFLSRLFGSDQPKNADVSPDAVWLTREAKFAALKRELNRAGGGSAVAVLLVAHFPETLKEIQPIVDEYDGVTPAMAVLASELSSAVANGLAGNEGQSIELIVTERHPLTSVDDQVLTEFAELLSCRCRVAYHVSLDEPLMKIFAGEAVTRMLKALGMDPNEKIVSPLVARRIRQAQTKLTAKATGNRKAESMEEWFKLNLP